MKKSDIKKTVTIYLANNANRLKGVISNMNYFVVIPAVNKDKRGKSEIAYGYAPDILAWQLEEDKYFNPWADKEPKKALDFGNGGITLINGDMIMEGKFQLKKGKTDYMFLLLMFLKEIT